MRGLHAVAADLGLEQLQLTTRDGHHFEAFYERFGYTVVGRHPGAVRVAHGDDRNEVMMVALLGRGAGIKSYTEHVKTAISIPDDDFARFERLAARHGMNRSEFYRLAGRRLAAELEGEAELTALANSVIARVGQPSADSPFLRESEHTVLEGTGW